MPAQYDSDDEGKNDPMVSQLILPFVFLVKVIVPNTGAQMDLNLLIDPGCTRCIINLPMVVKLGIHANLLPLAMRFEQADG